MNTFYVGSGLNTYSSKLHFPFKITFSVQNYIFCSKLHFPFKITFFIEYYIFRSKLHFSFKITFSVQNYIFRSILHFSFKITFYVQYYFLRNRQWRRQWRRNMTVLRSASWACSRLKSASRYVVNHLRSAQTSLNLLALLSLLTLLSLLASISLLASPNLLASLSYFWPENSSFLNLIKHYFLHFF